MKSNLLVILVSSIILLVAEACTNENEDPGPAISTYLDTLVVPHEMKGYELHSWHEGENWYFSVMAGTNRIKTYAEVISVNPSSTHLITVEGIDTLKLVLNKFPENEYITWIGEQWLQRCWGSNFGNLQLPPQTYIDEIARFCALKNLNLQVTE